MKAGVFHVILFMGCALCLFSTAAAQVVLDGTIGPSGETSLPGPNYIIRESYGERAGANLFHSLKTLNIDAEETADFSCASDVDNIIARVTGGASRIDGTLRSTLSRSGYLSNANLYLLNPMGVVFGPSARLDLGGSFHVSTADYLRMEGTDRFFSLPAQGEVLSSAPPAAFGFLSDTPAAIALEGDAVDPSAEDAPPGLRVRDGENISIVGGDIDIRGFYSQSYETDQDRFPRVSAPAGKIHIAAAAAPGDIALNDAELTQLDRMGDVRLSEGAQLTASGNGSGDIYIQGGAFLLDNGSIISDNDGPRDGGRIHIKADAISLTNGDIYSDNQLTYTPDPGETAGAGGEIRLEAAGSIEIQNNSYVFADTYFVSEKPVPTDVKAREAYHQEGRAGSIDLTAETVSIRSGGFVSSDSYGSGNGGDIHIKAQDAVALSSNGRIFSGTVGGRANDGNGGNIRIETPRFTMSELAVINADTYDGSGDGGSVTIAGSVDAGYPVDPNARLQPAEEITVSNSRIFAGAVDGAGDNAGNGGRVTLSADAISFVDGARIGSESLGAGRGGDIALSALNGTVRFSGANASGEYSRALTTADSEAPDAGDAGNIVIEAHTLVLEQGGGIAASTKGPGNAGAIDITVAEAINLTDPGTVISTGTTGQGQAGDIRVTAGSLTVQRHAAFSSASRNTGAAGDAGTITIASKGVLFVTEDGAVTTEALNAGGGRMIISSGDLLYVEDGQITTSVQQGAGNGGDIDATAPFIVSKNGQIIAKAFEGRGGNIRIVADQFITTPDSVVSASSELGIDGDIFIESPVTDISSFLAVLPDQFLDAGQWIVKSCAEQAVETASRFIVKEREGTPMPVDDWRTNPF